MLVEGLQLPFGIQPVNPVPINSWEGPYDSVSEANASIPLAVRFPTMEVRILDAIDGNKKYWYKDGIADIDLVDIGADLTEALNNEIIARISGDTLLQNEITGLTQTVEDNYVDLSNQITGLTTTVNTNFNTLYNDLTGETYNRISSDNDLQNQINNEVTGRTYNDLLLNNLITGETSNRIAADLILQNEITGLTATVGGNYTSLYNQLTGETYNRVTGDTFLYEQITGLTNNIKENYLNLTGGTINGDLNVTGGTVSGDGSGLYNIPASGVTGLQLDRLTYDGNSAIISSSGFTVNTDIYSEGIINGDGSGLFNVPASGVTGLQLDRIVSGGNSAIMSTSGLTINNDTTIEGELSVSGQTNIYGTLRIIGDIIQSGSTYETHAEQIYSTKDYIILRSGATGGLLPGEYTGFEAVNYDGINNGQLVFDKNGVARVGDVGATQAIATREEAPTDNYLTVWSSGNTRFETIIKNTSSIPPSTDRNYLTDSDVVKLDTLSSGSTYTNVINFNTHTGDTGLHLTTSQNTLLDGISGVTFTEINYLGGLTGSTQQQFNDITSVNHGDEIVITTGNTPTVGSNKLWINKAATGTTMFYNKTQIDTLLDGKSNTGHTHTQYLTGITANEIGVYTTGQTNALLTGYTLTIKRNSLTEVQTFTSNTTATISPNFDGALNTNDLFKFDSNYAGGTSVSISTYTNLPTFDICKNVIIKNSKNADITYNFATVDQTSGGITYSFKFMGGTSASSILVPTLKTIDIIYTFEFTSSTTCIISIIYKVEG